MYQGLRQDNGQSYHNWTLAHSTKPVVYVEPISYDDVCAVVSDPTRFPSPVNPVGSMYSVTETIVNNEGTLLCIKKLDEILGLEIDNSGRKVVRVQAGCRLKKLHLWLQRHELEIAFQSEIGEATVGSLSVGDSKDSSIDGPGYFSACVVSITYVDESGVLRVISEKENHFYAFKCSYGLSGIVVECLLEVRSATLCRSIILTHTHESPEDIVENLEKMKSECDALFATVILHNLTVVSDQRFKVGPGSVTPSTSQPDFDHFRIQRRLIIQHGGRSTTNGKPPSMSREVIYSRADLVNEYWRPLIDENRLDFQYYEHDFSNLRMVVRDSYDFTKSFQQHWGFVPNAWALYFVNRQEVIKKPFGLYSGGSGVSFSFDPVFSNPNDPEWQKFAKDYNQLAIHKLGGNPSPIQTQWLSSNDLRIPIELARPRFTTKYYAQFLR